MNLTIGDFMCLGGKAYVWTGQKWDESKLAIMEGPDNQKIVNFNWTGSGVVASINFTRKVESCRADDAVNGGLPWSVLKTIADSKTIGDALKVVRDDVYFADKTTKYMNMYTAGPIRVPKNKSSAIRGAEGFYTDILHESIDPWVYKPDPKAEQESKSLKHMAAAYFNKAADYGAYLGDVHFSSNQSLMPTVSQLGLRSDQKLPYKGEVIVIDRKKVRNCHTFVPNHRNVSVFMVADNDVHLQHVGGANISREQVPFGASFLLFSDYVNHYWPGCKWENGVLKVRSDSPYVNSLPIEVKHKGIPVQFPIDARDRFWVGQAVANRSGELFVVVGATEKGHGLEYEVRQIGSVYNPTTMMHEQKLMGLAQYFAHKGGHCHSDGRSMFEIEWFNNNPVLIKHPNATLNHPALTPDIKRYFGIDSESKEQAERPYFMHKHEMLFQSSAIVIDESHDLLAKIHFLGSEKMDSAGFTGVNLHSSKPINEEQAYRDKQDAIFRDIF